MNFLDIRTLAFAAMFVMLVMSVAMYVVWRSRDESCLKYWWMAGFSVTGGLILLILRDQIPDVLSVVVANTVIAVGSGCTLAGVDAFLGRKPNWRAVGIVAALVFVSFWYFTFVHLNINYRVVVISIASAGFAAVGAYRLATDPEADGLGAARIFTVVAMGLHVAYTAVRIVLTITDAPIASFMAAGPVQASVALNLIFTAVAQTFGFFALVDQRHLKQVERAQVAAERENVAKSEFLANMAHELRTPLNAVIGFSEIMAQEVLGPIPSKYREYASDIRLSGTQLLALINDVLDLAKIDAGRLELRETEFNIGESIRRVVTTLSGLARQHGVKVEYASDDFDLPTLLADQLRVEQILGNLLTNAVKFGPKGLVRIDVYLDQEEIVVNVHDTGPGMTEEEINHALTRFGQAGYIHLTSRLQGTGLGLPVASALARLHGGRITIDSQVGVGTNAALRLPAQRMRTIEVAA
jgi:signal transduction histidine kinase